MFLILIFFYFRVKAREKNSKKEKKEAKGWKIEAKVAQRHKRDTSTHSREVISGVSIRHMHHRSDQWIANLTSLSLYMTEKVKDKRNHNNDTKNISAHQRLDR